MDMKQWLREQLALQRKKAMPVLSFPAISQMDITVSQLISSASYRPRASPGGRRGGQCSLGEHDGLVCGGRGLRRPGALFRRRSAHRDAGPDYG